MEGYSFRPVNIQNTHPGRRRQAQPSRPALTPNGYLTSPLHLDSHLDIRQTAPPYPQFNSQFFPPEVVNPQELHNFEQQHLRTTDSGYVSSETTATQSTYLTFNNNAVWYPPPHALNFPVPPSSSKPEPMPPDKTSDEDVGIHHKEYGPSSPPVPAEVPTRKKRARKPSGQGNDDIPCLHNRPGKTPRTDLFSFQYDDGTPMMNIHQTNTHLLQPPPPNVEQALPNTAYNVMPTNRHEAGKTIMSKEQKKLIRHWYKSFAKKPGYLSGDQYKALSVLVDLPPRSIQNWVNRKFIRPHQESIPNTAVSIDENSQDAIITAPKNVYSVTVANSHLPRDVLHLVDRYVKSSQRRRAQSDGRRSVNTGPYICTSGCGYRTKRVYDWKRHEETHQPQKLWLCHVCRQNGNQNPFLVNRNDKFLKHVKDAHQEWDAEHVLEKSKVDFRAEFNRYCHICTESFEDWEEKCRHVLAHYEDNEYRSKHQEPVPKKQESEDESTSSSSPDSSESSDEDDDGDDDQPDLGGNANARDATGGSGGGSGTLGGFTPFRSGGKGDTNRTSYTQGPYHQYYGSTSFAASSERNPPNPSGARPMIWGFSSTHGARSVSRTRIASKSPLTITQPLLSGNNAKPSSWHQDALSRTPLVWMTGLPYRHRSSFQDSMPTLTYLGHGAHGSVDTVQEYLTGKVYARKRCMSRGFPNEIAIMKRMDHPHIVKYVTAYVQNASLNLIMSPVAQLTLKDYLTRVAWMKNDAERLHIWIGCLSSALSHIHSRGIRHADIKPQNILIRDTDVFISDFGISRVVSEPDSTSSSISPSTPFYAAMEIAERLPHGRKSDVFSLGCVVVELLTVAQGKTVMELHDFLGLSRTKKRSRDGPAYWKVQERLLSWIAMMKLSASSRRQCLWEICKCMVQNRPELRPTSSILVDKVRRALKSISEGGCPNCTPEISILDERFSFQPDKSIETSPGTVARTTPVPDPWRDPGQHTLDYHARTPEDLGLPPITGRITELDETDAVDSCTTLCPTPRSPTPSKCFCPGTEKEKELFLYTELADVLEEWERSGNDPSSFKVPNLLYALATFQGPPAYDEVNASPIACFALMHESIVSWTCNDTLADLVVEPPDTDGKLGTGFLQEGWMLKSRGVRAFTPSGQTDISCHPTCHECSLQLVGRQDKCANCSHIRCEQCTVTSSTPVSRRQEWPRKADSDLAAIGSHLLPPAYSPVDNPSTPSVSVAPRASYTGVQTDEAVFNLVIAQNKSHGDDPVQRFIRDSPSTFDRIQEPVHGHDAKWFFPQSNINPALNETPPRLSQPEDISPISPEGYITSNKRLKLDNDPSQQPPTSPQIQPTRFVTRRQSRQRVSGRSKQTVRRQQPEMRFRKSASRPDIQPSTPLETHTQGRFRLTSHQKRNSTDTYPFDSNGDAAPGTLRSGTSARMSRTESMGSTNSDSSTYDAYRTPRNMHYTGSERGGSATNRRPSPMDLSSTHTSMAGSPTKAIHSAVFRTDGFQAGVSDLSGSRSLSRSPSPSSSPSRGRRPYRRSTDTLSSGQNHTAFDPFIGSAGASPPAGSSPGGHSPSQTNFYYGRHGNTWLFNDISFTGSVKKGFNGLSRIMHHKGHGGHGSGDRGEEGGEE